MDTTALGTIPQWLTLIALAIGIFRVLPDWIRSRTEARAAAIKAELDEGGFLVGGWKGMAELTLSKLTKCEEESVKFAARVTALEGENNRFKIALSLVLHEIGLMDPASEIVRRAHAVMGSKMFGTDPVELETLVAELKK